MADPRSQYSMMSNFGPGAAGMMQHHQLNAMQQQQQQQPGQQQQDSQQQPHPGMSSFNDSNRVWSQMQQMQSMRAQNGQDMNTPSAQQQMANLLRSQNLAQMQSQQQSFGMGMGGAPNPGQQRSFLEQQNQTPHNVQMGFSGMEQHNQGFQPSMPNRQSMLQALQGSQSHTRQLELMGLAQNQQNQNSPTNLGNRVANGIPMNGNPQALNSLQPPNDLAFNPNNMRRPSPHPPLQPPLMANQPANGTINVQGRTINMADLTDRAATLRNMIQAMEVSMRQLHSQRATMPDNVFMAKMRQLQTDMTGRKDSLTKIMTLMNICIQQSANGGSINNMGGPSQGSPPGNGGQPWPPSPFGNNNQQPTMPNSQAPVLGNGPSPAPPHPPAGLPPPNNIPRPVTTPQQSMNSFPMNGSQLNFPGNSPANVDPGPSNLGPSGSAPPVNLNMPIPPLDKSRFETSYKQWCLTKAIVHNPQLLAIDSRQIDLYQLHCQVMREGGLGSVTRRELWPVIGGRLNFVHFPGSATEPPKSGPAAAMQIQHIYKEYLSAFDAVYMASVMDSRRKAAGLPATSQLSGQFISQGPTMPVTLEALRKLSPPQVDMILSCADKPANELRARGMADSMISFIENHRPMLQSMAAERASFSEGLRGRQPPGPNPVAGPNGNVGQPQFPNSGMNMGGNMNPQLRPPGEHPGPTIPRPTRDQISMAHIGINRLKSEYHARILPVMSAVDVPPESRAEYNSLLELVLRNANELESKLPIYSVVTKNEDGTKKLLTAIVSVQHQRSLLGSNTPKYVLTLDTLRAFGNHLQHAVRQIHAIIQNIVKGGEQHPPLGPPGPFLDNQPINGLVPGGRGIPPGPPQPHPGMQHPSPSSVQTNPPVAHRPPPIPPNQTPTAPPPAKVKKPTGAPTPPASAPTPVASAPTPTAPAASPPTPKSPKSKPPPKKTKPVRKPSTPTTKVNATPTLEPAPIPAPPTAGVKRPRDEEAEASLPTPGPSTGPSSVPLPPAAAVASEPSPPKRVKTDWEGPVSESLQKKNQQVENIKTEEDATQFLEQMTELIKMAGTEDQASLSSDISDTLEQILRGYGGPVDSDTSFSSLGLGDVGSALDASASTSAPPASSDFTEFFDFSLFPNEDESESKMGTPDLISSSSTNPSPESQADADPANSAAASLDVKQEKVDPLRLSSLKEIDGGESTFYQSTEWKWDGHMPTLEAPWAIFNS
ncbi:hypothetical protein GYMLUDRAFT_41817 [Collybiopsis luxurians FD-317 M1]|uniref:ARID domain-containing protein n=1 Tax=Collybiopsis luxurians FD-317 M1 TaxID=944289 RepID=A0A0D0BF14_9AGAR|nr:hypothetical protein GYMLUDRAFT_41817 [Collybiopsis luxurians FD-317 M1]